MQEDAEMFFQAEAGEAAAVATAGGVAADIEGK